MSKARLNPMMEWKDIPWRKLERYTFKLQKRIFKASERGDIKACRRLQKTLMRSRSSKCLAVRRVTQDNQGKKTAGVDGIKSLKPEERLELVNNLSLSRKAKPTRRVWIPKPGTEEKRPLGIPTITDRASQALVKQALEPEWEARFEPNSYGFRPGRSCQDAIGAIYSAIRLKAKYVLDADIAKCFDRISHEALLNKLNTFPTIRRQVRAWLKAGVMDGKQLFPTSEGTPQGGVISPLLANIALHGMENRINQVFPESQEALIGKLNPVIRGCANYYSAVVSTRTFSKLDHIVYQQLLAWGKFTHPHTSVKQIVNKCWQTIGGDHWVFATKEGGKITARLQKHSQIKIVRHEKVKGKASPYDGNLVYWSTRRSKHPECPERIAELLRQQNGMCVWCKLQFREEDLLEIDHTLPISQGGKDIKSNRQLLHRHCHDEKTALDTSKLQEQLAHEEFTRYLDDNPW